MPGHLGTGASRLNSRRTAPTRDGPERYQPGHHQGIGLRFRNRKRTDVEVGMQRACGIPLSFTATPAVELKVNDAVIDRFVRVQCGLRTDLLRSPRLSHSG